MERRKRELDEEESKCPECQGPIVTDHERGERHCETCGLVVDDEMITHNQPEYRVYDDDQKTRIRLGPPSSESMHDKGLPTQIGPAMKDFQGRPLSPSARRDAHRLRKWQLRSRVVNSQDRNLVYALQEMGTRAAQLQLTEDVRDEAVHMYRRCVSENVIRGRSIMAVMAASFYLAGRICRHPMTLDEISVSMGVSRKECGRIARFLKRKFRLKVDAPTCDDFLERFLDMKCPRCNAGKNDNGESCEFCSGTGRIVMSRQTATRARALMLMCEEHGLYSGKAPMGLVAAVIYTSVADKSITQRDVAKVCSITEVTLRNRCNDIRELLQRYGGDR